MGRSYSGRVRFWFWSFFILVSVVPVVLSFPFGGFAPAVPVLQHATDL